MIVIIHGIGTGIVKNEVHEALRVNKNVLEYKTDNFNSGCTVARLKISLWVEVFFIFDIFLEKFINKRSKIKIFLE